MKLVLYYYTCKVCGTKFKSPQINGYGEFLMRSDHGELAYLNAIEDPIFNQITNIIKQGSDYKGNELNKVKVFHNSFGVTCDPAKDGSLFQITNKPKCPKCNSTEYANFGITDPPETVDLDIKPVTHMFWQNLTSEQQQSIIALIVGNESENAKALLNKWKEV